MDTKGINLPAATVAVYFAALDSADDVLRDLSELNLPTQDYWNKGGKGYDAARQVREALFAGRDAME